VSTSHLYCRSSWPNLSRGMLLLGGTHRPGIPSIPIDRLQYRKVAVILGLSFKPAHSVRAVDLRFSRRKYNSQLRGCLVFLHRAMLWGKEMPPSALRRPERLIAAFGQWPRWQWRSLPGWSSPLHSARISGAFGPEWARATPGSLLPRATRREPPRQDPPQGAAV
jgi:hypothetical protein